MTRYLYSLGEFDPIRDLYVKQLDSWVVFISVD